MPINEQGQLALANARARARALSESMTPFSADFVEWHGDTDRLLRSLFGEQSEILRSFREVRFECSPDAKESLRRAFEAAQEGVQSSISRLQPDAPGKLGDFARSEMEDTFHSLSPEKRKILNAALESIRGVDFPDKLIERNSFRRAMHEVDEILLAAVLQLRDRGQ